MTEVCNPLLLVVEEAAGPISALLSAAPAIACRLQTAHSAAQAFEAAYVERPDILLCSAHLPDGNGAAFCQRIRNDDYLRACYLLLGVETPDEIIPDATEGVPDDYLFFPLGPIEIAMRLRVALRFVAALQTQEQMNTELEINRIQVEQSREEHEQIDSHLVEIAAQLQSELYRNAEQEAERIWTARMDTVMQAAATLQHEINNPLFAITGSAESALKRLHEMSMQGVVEANALKGRLERVLQGADRIRQVVQSFSKITAPTTRDYLPGLPMLELQASSQDSAA